MIPARRAAEVALVRSRTPTASRAVADALRDARAAGKAEAVGHLDVAERLLREGADAAERAAGALRDAADSASDAAALMRAEATALSNGPRRLVPALGPRGQIVWEVVPERRPSTPPLGVPAIVEAEVSRRVDSLWTVAGASR